MEGAVRAPRKRNLRWGGAPERRFGMPPQPMVFKAD
jgi:hypothetical protein